jgi:putative serine protease PepD
MPEYSSGNHQEYSDSNTHRRVPNAYESNPLPPRGEPVIPAQYAPSGKKPTSPKKSFLYSFLGASLACVLAFSGFGAFSLVSNSGISGVADVITDATLGSSSDTNIIQTAENTTLAENVAEKCLPSVVSIYVYTSYSSQGFGGMFGFGMGPNSPDNSGEEELVQSGMGSGVVLSEDGYIITNYHVAEGAEQMMVSLGGDSELLEASLVGADESSDIAVIKLTSTGESDLSPIEIGNSSELSIGEWVMALGSPFGLEQSVSTGIVSAVSRSYAMESSSGTMLYTNLIQTDTAINQGNSGGALVDSNGKLIGINTLISSTSGDSSGVGFAIPVDYAIGIAQDLIAGKTPTHAQLGVSLSSVTSSVAMRYGLSATEGAYIDNVLEGKAADEAGIRARDIITAFNGKKISSASDLMLAIRSLNPGDTVEAEINREGEMITVEVTLGSDAI